MRFRSGIGFSPDAGWGCPPERASRRWNGDAPCCTPRSIPRPHGALAPGCRSVVGGTARTPRTNLTTRPSRCPAPYRCAPSAGSHACSGTRRRTVPRCTRHPGLCRRIRLNSAPGVQYRAVRYAGRFAEAEVVASVGFTTRQLRTTRWPRRSTRRARRADLQRRPLDRHRRPRDHRRRIHRSVQPPAAPPRDWLQPTRRGRNQPLQVSAFTTNGTGQPSLYKTRSLTRKSPCNARNKLCPRTTSSLLVCALPCANLCRGG